LRLVITPLLCGCILCCQRTDIATARSPGSSCAELSTVGVYKVAVSVVLDDTGG